MRLRHVVEAQRGNNASEIKQSCVFKVFSCCFSDDGLLPRGGGPADVFSDVGARNEVTASNKSGLSEKLFKKKLN